MADKPIALLADPRLEDLASFGRPLIETVEDSRPIEPGDIFLTVRELDQENPPQKNASISIATFKPGKNPMLWGVTRFPLPQGNRQLYMHALELIDVSSLTGPERSFVANIRDEEISFDDTDFDHRRPPVKAYTSIDFQTSGMGKNSPILLEKPRRKSSISQKILDSETDLANLNFTQEEKVALLENARQVRIFLEKNLPVLENAIIGREDPRLKQLDNLINFLWVQTTFSAKAK